MATKAMIFQTLLAGLRFDGATANGYLAYFYVPGDPNTLKAVYADRNKATPAANPYTLDANGRAEVFGDGVYDVVIKTAAGTTKSTWENVALNDPTSTAVANAVDYASLNAAVTAIGSTPTRLFINAELPVTANVVVPATLELEFTRAGSLSHGAYTITFSGTDPVAGRHQIFNGTGAVTGLTVSRPEWFGTGDAAMQESMNASAYQIWDGTYTGINTTIEAPSGRDTYITGHGSVSGTANPLLKSSLPLADYFSVNGISFNMASAQLGVYVLKTWEATPQPSFNISNCTFTATHNGAGGLKILGAREGNLRGNNFIRSGYDGTGAALQFTGIADGGAMNIHISDTSIKGFRYGIYADGVNSLYLAGLHFVNTTIIGSGTPILAQNVNDLRFTNLMSDNNQNTAQLTNIDSGSIIGGWINCVGSESALDLIANSTTNIFQDFAIVGVKFYENDLSTGKNGVGITATGASVTMKNVTISDSTFTACDTGIYAVGTSGGTVNGTKVRGCKFDTCNAGTWFDTGAINSLATDNTFTTVTTGIVNEGIQNSYNYNVFEPDVTTRVTSTGNSGYLGQARINGAWTRNSGVATFNGNGVQVEFNIAHGLPLAPNKEISVLPASGDAAAVSWVTNDATYITITMAAPPPAGSDNVIFYWTGECLLE